MGAVCWLMKEGVNAGMGVKDPIALTLLNRCLLCGGDVHSIVPASSHADVLRLQVRIEEMRDPAPTLGLHTRNRRETDVRRHCLTARDDIDDSLSW